MSKTYWVSSPDGKKTEEHTQTNASELKRHLGWVDAQSPAGDGKKEPVKVPKKPKDGGKSPVKKQGAGSAKKEIGEDKKGK